MVVAISKEVFGLGGGSGYLYSNVVVLLCPFLS